MKRFYKEVSLQPVDGRFQITLDGRGIKTARGAAQLLPTRTLAEAMAEEWARQGDVIDTGSFIFRDMADYALDVVAKDTAAEVASVLPYAETDTLCYRADPDEPLYARQRERWEPFLEEIEQRHGLKFERVSGIMHRPQPEATLVSLRATLEGFDPFRLAAVKTMASLAASMVIALAALEDGAEAEELWALANLEEDWQAEQWGWDPNAEAKRRRKMGEFAQVRRFAQLARA